MTATLDDIDQTLTLGGFVREAALDQALARLTSPGDRWQTWPADRRAIAAEQMVYRAAGIEVGLIDGLAGPQTRAAREAYAYRRANGRLPDWRDADPVLTDAPVIPARSTWPRQAEMAAFYGRPGPEVESRLVTVECPWTLVIAWDPAKTTRRIRIHRLCADSLQEVLAAQLAAYGEDGLRAIGAHLWGGSYAHRRMRGGTAWSTHAYGCALDFDPSRNGLHTRGPAARLSHPDAVRWWEIWEAAGWTSLGRARGYDWMHVQAARL